MKRDVKVFLLMLLGAIVLFFIVPLVVNLQPNEQVSIIGTQVSYLILNMIFMGVVGWFAQSFEKYGAFVPLVLVILHVLSQAIFFQGLIPVLVFQYLEASYMIFLLKKLLDRKKKREEEKRKPKAFPKSVTKR